MALLKKIKADWLPSEKPDLAIGEVLEVTDYRRLVQSGTAILVDENGNELPLPGVRFNCPICFTETSSLTEFVNHVDSHKKPITESVVKTVAEAENTRGSAEPNKVAPVEESVPSVPKPILSDIRAKRLANLEKARAIRKMNLENK